MSEAEIRSHEPRAEVLGCYGGPPYAVYGWTAEMQVSNDRWLPLRRLVSLHDFRWRAERARRRWLAQQPVPHGGT